MPLLRQHHQRLPMPAATHSLPCWWVLCPHPIPSPARAMWYGPIATPPAMAPPSIGPTPIPLTTPLHSLHLLLVSQQYPVLLMPLPRQHHQRLPMPAAIPSLPCWWVLCPHPIPSPARAMWYGPIATPPAMAPPSIGPIPILLTTRLHSLHLPLVSQQYLVLL